MEEGESSQQLCEGGMNKVDKQQAWISESKKEQSTEQGLGSYLKHSHAIIDFLYLCLLNG